MSLISLTFRTINLQLKQFIVIPGIVDRTKSHPTLVDNIKKCQIRPIWCISGLISDQSDTLLTVDVVNCRSASVFQRLRDKEIIHRQNGNASKLLRRLEIESLYQNIKKSYVVYVFFRLFFLTSCLNGVTNELYIPVASRK